MKIYLYIPWKDAQRFIIFVMLPEKQVQVLLLTCFDLQFHLIFLCRDIYFVVELDIPSVGKSVILFRDDAILDADFLLDCHTSNFLENLGCLQSHVFLGELCATLLQLYAEPTDGLLSAFNLKLLLLANDSKD